AATMQPRSSMVRSWNSWPTRSAAFARRPSARGIRDCDSRHLPKLFAAFDSTRVPFTTASSMAFWSSVSMAMPRMSWKYAQGSRAYFARSVGSRPEVLVPLSLLRSKARDAGFRNDRCAVPLLGDLDEESFDSLVICHPHPLQ